MSYPHVHVRAEFDLGELIIWLQAAQARWEDGGTVTGRLEGTAINLYQGGIFRAAIDLDAERPHISHWADNEA